MCENCRKQNTTFDGANISEYEGKKVVQNILIYEVPNRGKGNAYPVVSRTPASVSPAGIDAKAEARTLLGLSLERMLMTGMDPVKELETAMDALEAFVAERILGELLGDDFFTPFGNPAARGNVM